VFFDPLFSGCEVSGMGFHTAVVSHAHGDDVLESLGKGNVGRRSKSILQNHPYPCRVFLTFDVRHQRPRDGGQQRCTRPRRLRLPSIDELVVRLLLFRRRRSRHCVRESRLGFVDNVENLLVTEDGSDLSRLWTIIPVVQAFDLGRGGRLVVVFRHSDVWDDGNLVLVVSKVDFRIGTWSNAGIATFEWGCRC
jgi:hypothetical protein